MITTNKVFNINVKKKKKMYLRNPGNECVNLAPPPHLTPNRSELIVSYSS